MISQETKNRMSKSHIGVGKGRTQTKEHISKRVKGLIGKKRTLETRMVLSEKKKGDRNPNWKGGVSPVNTLIRMSVEYRLWREAVFKRDNWTCIWCNTKGGWNKELKENIHVQADHIKPFADYPELRFAIDNGRTLCTKCHKTTDTYGWNKFNKSVPIK